MERMMQKTFGTIRTRFGGNANSKKMQKAVLKQQFEAFTISSSEGLEKGYDRFQQLLSQLEAHGAEVSTEDANHNVSRTIATIWFLSEDLTREVPAGFADEVIYSLFAKQSEDLDLLHEDLEQIDDVDIEEMDINWQIAMIAIRMKKFYKKTGRRVRIDGNKPVGFDKKKLECFKCHNTGHFARECPSKGTNDGKKRDSFYLDQGAGKKEQSQNCLLTMDDGVVNWGEHTVEEEETNHALMAISSNTEQQLSLNEQLTFQANEIYAKDEKLKRYRRIGMKAVKEKEQLKKTVDSWKDSSKNLWKLIDSGMSSTSKVGLGYEIKSNNEFLSYEEEMNRSVFKCTKEDYINKPLYSRFTKTNSFKGVPHPLTGDYTPKPQEEIDDSLYVYGKKGPQKPEISDSDDNSTEHSTCQSNDSEGSCGNTSKHSFESESESISVPNEMSTSNLSHLIKDCDYYEKKMTREAEFKKQRVFNTGNRVAKPVWTNANRVNHANQFVPRSVQLNTGRTNVNSVRPRVNTGSSNVNTVRSRQPVPTRTSNSFSPKRPQIMAPNLRIGICLNSVETRVKYGNLPTRKMVLSDSESEDAANSSIPGRNLGKEDVFETPKGNDSGGVSSGDRKFKSATEEIKSGFTSISSGEVRQAEIERKAELHNRLDSMVAKKDWNDEFEMSGSNKEKELSEVQQSSSTYHPS
ncbi:ribonuclease H-like domain-containing protein [Tanacetum coccineum]